MTYEEYFRHIGEMREATKGREATEQEIDEEIALVSKLPCTGEGSPSFSAGEQAPATMRWLDGKVFAIGPGCPHCGWLAMYKWVKSAHEARRNGLPEPWPSWVPKPQS